MTMLKHTVFHSNEYTHPGWMIIMACILCIATFLCELVNSVNIIDQTTVSGTAIGFAAFEVFVMIQDLYLRGRQNFKVKGSVPKYPLVIVKDLKKIYGPFDESNPKPKGNIKVYYHVYRIVRIFYTCIYFYFMPFLALIYPIT